MQPLGADSGLVVQVQYATERKGVPSAGELRRYATAALSGRLQRAEVLIRVVGENESAELNRSYRGKDAPTNVLSFPFEPPPGVPSALLGDVIVCAAVVRREAKEQGKPARAHWAHMVVHGCLHLLGYDHQDDEQAQEMESLETDILARLGIEDPYATDGQVRTAAPRSQEHR